MDKNFSYGPITEHSIGIIMRDVVWRAMEIIRRARFNFEAHAKDSGYKEEDFLTNADTAAQDVYVKVLSENFPDYGIIAEENNLARPSKVAEHDIYFTIDPLDGTKAFIRKQSTGIGSMLSLVCDGKIIAVCIGDVMTGELYYYRPNSIHTHRISGNEPAEKLVTEETKTLREQYTILRDDPRNYSEIVQKMTDPNNEARLFKSIDVEGGSIGVTFARLWKGEVGAIILNSTYETPWDSTPVLGISEKLGFLLLEIKPDRSVVEIPIVPPKTILHADSERIIIHKNKKQELLDWLTK